MKIAHNLGAAANADFDLLEEHLSRDVESSLAAGIKANAVYEQAGDPLEQFKLCVDRAIRSIESKDKTDLLPRFLEIGPYVDAGQIPMGKVDKYLSDDVVAAAIRKIFSSAINSFQGQLAEMLAIRAVLELKREVPILSNSVLYIGDSIKTKKPGKADWAKAADMHYLSGIKDKREVRCLVEVKSYIPNEDTVGTQLRRHGQRARRGLRIGEDEFTAKQVILGDGRNRPVMITVVPDTWALPRKYAFETRDGRTFLVVEPPEPPRQRDRLEQVAKEQWRIILRWSEEALAAAAYGLTFWYMGELGRIIYEKGVPPELSQMTPEQAGQNAMVQSLYYAMLRARTVRESSRAIALYNSYGFGYSLGANFVDRKGRRQELFYEDLHEILENGRSRTKPLDDKHPAQICRIRGLKWPSGPCTGTGAR